jgi:ectoine hydroxylase-related dioxygenase (phytanoyl-CoA dioxygenase family)
MEIKVGYYLSDLTEHNSGALCVVPGSHKRKPQELRDLDFRVDPAEMIELNFRPNTALVWRTAVWHCVSPNLSDHVRKVMYYGYHYRWLRPTDYVQQDPALIARSTPVRRQLLGALATDDHVLGGDPEWEPASQQWIPKNWDNVPLKRWAEEQIGKGDRKMDKVLHL